MDEEAYLKAWAIVCNSVLDERARYEEIIEGGDDDTVS